MLILVYRVGYGAGHGYSPHKHTRSNTRRVRGPSGQAMELGNSVMGMMRPEDTPDCDLD